MCGYELFTQINELFSKDKKAYFHRTKAKVGDEWLTFLHSGVTGHPSIIFTFALCTAINSSPKSINYFQRTKRHIFKGRKAGWRLEASFLIFLDILQ